MTPRRNPFRHWLWLCASWAALLGYAGTGSPLGAVGAALLAECDSGHQVKFVMNAAGARVVLQHDRSGPAHQHGLVARTLTAFAAPLRRGAPDHVLQFNSAAPATKPTPSERLDSAAAAPLASILPEVGPNTPALIHFAPAPAPVLTPPLRFCCRSTSLLL